MKNHSLTKISLSWSGGKDSSLALFFLKENPRYQVVRLHTVIGEETKTVNLHGIHINLIKQQADLIGLPLDIIYLPMGAANSEYEKAIHQYLDMLEAEGILHVAFGDIFLEELRKYRQDQLALRGFEAVFPLWGADTNRLARDFIDLGFKTLICAADADKIDSRFMGEVFGPRFLDSLSGDVDPCGENGEFHTFCFDGPIFQNPLDCFRGDLLSKSYAVKKVDGSLEEKHYWFQEILSEKQ